MTAAPVAFAQDAANPNVQTLPPIVITADPFADRGALDVTAPADALGDDALRRARAGTIGDVLNDLPGVANASFGPGAGRVVIRGQSGPRVRVLSDGIGTQDVSVSSPDHVITVEPFRAEQIEVIRGPATLQYGSGAIGGIVNVVEHAIAREPFDGVGVRAGTQFQTDRGGRTGYAGLTLGNGSFVGHVDALVARSRELEIPGFGDIDAGEEHHEDEDHDEDHEDEEHEDEEPGRLENSFSDRESASLGLSWVGARGHVGIAVTTLDHTYGLPGGHGHGHEDEHEDEEHEDEEHGEEEAVFLDIEQVRTALDGELRNPFAGFSRVHGALVISEYDHIEFEGPGEPGTVFSNDALEGRLELTHNTFSLLGGEMQGVIGVQYQDTEFAAVGEEAFVPPVNTDLTGVFFIEEWTRGPLRLEAGLRAETVDHQSATGASADFPPGSLSLGAVYQPLKGVAIALRAGQSERAPVAEELFSNGPHLATSTFEIGDVGLELESATNLDLSLRVERDRYFGRLSVFTTDYSDFIFQDSVDANGDGEADRVDEEGEFEEDGELLLVNYAQADAEFSGAELELGAALFENAFGRVVLSVFADTVTGELTNGGNLPRITPDRVGLQALWTRGITTARLRLTDVSDQTDVAALETATAGYQRLDADIEWAVPGPGGDWFVGLRGRNLLDEEIREHTSFLKDTAPAPGRGVILDFDYRFGG